MGKISNDRLMQNLSEIMSKEYGVQVTFATVPNVEWIYNKRLMEVLSPSVYAQIFLPYVFCRLSPFTTAL